jgi:NAD(P)-dependent dehydrogenase (short-subunit alcohol dehydrogenase family)
VKGLNVDLNLKGKVALVTGAGSGFGSAVATALAAEGCVLYLADINLTAAEHVERSLGANAHALAMDVGDVAEVRDKIEWIANRQGRVDILVNNAGVLKVGSIIDSSNEDWDQVCRVNLSGVFYCSKAVLPLMLKQRSGKIINMASISAFKGGGVFGNALYGTTKAGVIALTKGFARELGPFGINVNSIAPGLADTGMTSRYFNDENRRQISQAIPMGRLATTDDIAKLVVFLASDASAYITGETITIDGGYLTK